MPAPLVYIIAGEASGDALGAGLMQALSAARPGIRFAGIGGEAMQAQGLESLFPYSELSIMGFAEVVPHIPQMLKRLRETQLDIMIRQPDIVVTIDSPGFTFRLAAKLRGHGKTRRIRRVHYVAPSVWAYKPERARKTAALFDALLALLPFEPPYFEKEGLPTSFVGHPVLWDAAPGDDAAFRRRHHIAANARLLLLLPGSRRGEVKRHLDLFMKAALALPDFTPVVLAGTQVRSLIQQHCPPGTRLCDISEKNDAFAAAELALSKSGTITLELAVAGVPTVVAHRVSPLSAWLIRRMRLTTLVSLVNIAANKMILPELLQEHCRLGEIVLALQTLSHKEAMEQQRNDAKQALMLLKGDSAEHPSLLAAKTILGYFDAPNSKI